MTARLAQRLRAAEADQWLMNLCHDAADEIERLTRAVTELGKVQHRLEQELQKIATYREQAVDKAP